MKSILDPSFKYTPSEQTNLRESFARWRRARGMPPVVKLVKQPSPLRISGNSKKEGK